MTAASIEQLQRLVEERPFSARWNYRLLELDDGYARLLVPYHPDWDRQGDVLSGPVYMAAADCAMWMAVMSRGVDEVGAVTTELGTTFLSAGRAEDITCSARVLRWGRRLVFGVAECRGADERLLTYHTLTYARGRPNPG